MRLSSVATGPAYCLPACLPLRAPAGQKPEQIEREKRQSWRAERERERERDVAMDDRPEQNLDHC